MTSPTVTWADDVDSRTNRYVRRWMRHFPLLRATSVEAWAARLGEAALPSQVRVLTPAERDLLVEDCWRRERGRPSLEPEAFDPLVLALEERVLEAQRASKVGAAFVRLGFRAPLDSPQATEGQLQVDGGPEALEVLLDSERMFDDLCLAQECGYCPAVVVRPWLEIAPGDELRAFVRGRRLVGLSQRHPARPEPRLIARAGELEAAARRACDALRSAWPLDDLVVDLACLDGEARGGIL